MEENSERAKTAEAAVGRGFTDQESEINGMKQL